MNFIKSRKFKKLINNPSMFFRDFFYKRFHKNIKVNYKEVATAYPNEKFHVFFSGDLTDTLNVLNEKFILYSKEFEFFFADKNFYWELKFENSTYQANELNKNPINSLGNGYSLFLHSSDEFSSNFINSFVNDANSNKSELISPSFFEASNKTSAPIKRKIKTKFEFFETINGLLIKNSLIKKVPQCDEVSWDLFEGSHLLLGVLSLIDIRKIKINQVARYIYIKKPFGSSFRLSRDEGISNSCVLYMQLLNVYINHLKGGNEDVFFRPFLYNLIAFCNFGFSKKKLAWLNETSFADLIGSLTPLIPGKFLIEFKSLISERNEVLINHAYEKDNFFYLRDVDRKNNQYLFSCYSKSIECLNSNKDSLCGGFLMNKKIVKHVYFNDAIVFELRMWVARPLTANDDLAFAGGVIIYSNKKVDSLSNFELLKFKNKKNHYFDYSTEFSKCWLLMDRDDQADDNAEHLYRYLKSIKGFEKSIYFCLRSDSHDWERLDKEGFQLIEYGSDRHESALNACEKIISSHAAAFVFDYFKDKRLFEKDLVFLQHGVIYNDLSTLFEPEWKKINLFITSATREYNDFVDDNTPYKFTDKEVKLTGLPRHDALLKKSNLHKKKFPNQKRILIMPTWRPYLLGAVKSGTERELIDNFEESKYFIFWNSFLQSDILKKIFAQGVEIDFFPHANVTQYIDKFEIPEHVNIRTFSKIGIQDVFASASLMVTDYSSVSFEMAFLQKPVVYYQFDEDEFYSKGVYNKGYFDTAVDGFGPVVRNQEELNVALDEFCKRDFAAEEIHLNRMREFFPYRDGNSCERVLKCIENLDHLKNDSFYNDQYLSNLILNKSYKKALEFSLKLKNEHYQDLCEFLKWRLNGEKPLFEEGSPYQKFYLTEVCFLNFDFYYLKSLEINSSDILLNLIFNEFLKFRDGVEKHLNSGEVFNDLFPGELFYSNVLNAYFSCDWGELERALNENNKLNNIKELNLIDIRVMKIIFLARGNEYFDALVNSYMDKYEFNSKLLKIYKKIKRKKFDSFDDFLSEDPFSMGCLKFLGLVSN